jgi:hypothetical protein
MTTKERRDASGCLMSASKSRVVTLPHVSPNPTIDYLLPRGETRSLGDDERLTQHFEGGFFHRLNM